MRQWLGVCRSIEERHGLPGARRARGAWGARSRPPLVVVLERFYVMTGAGGGDRSRRPGTPGAGSDRAGGGSERCVPWWHPTRLAPSRPDRFTLHPWSSSSSGCEALRHAHRKRGVARRIPGRGPQAPIGECFRQYLWRQRRTVSRVLCPVRGGDHLSRTPVARRLKRPYPRARAGHPMALLFGLAPGGVCRAGAVTRVAGELLPHRFTLTALPWKSGGLLSVALSVGSPPLGVTQHLALWSPDFPLATLPWPATARSSLAPLTV